ncbi:unnamed protein product, partial [Pylaiella littoralis]
PLTHLQLTRTASIRGCRRVRMRGASPEGVLDRQKEREGNTTVLARTIRSNCTTRRRN